MIEIADKTMRTDKYVLEFNYITNKGETEKRKCIASSITYGVNPVYTEPGWLMFAFCLDSMHYKTFAMKNMTNVKYYLG